MIEIEGVAKGCPLLATRSKSNRCQDQMHSLVQSVGIFALPYMASMVPGNLTMVARFGVVCGPISALCKACFWLVLGAFCQPG